MKPEILSYCLTFTLMTGFSGCSIRNNPQATEQRIQDVSNLLVLHSELGFTNSKIQDLVAFGRSNGVLLVNPIAIDKSKPSYRVVWASPQVPRAETNAPLDLKRFNDVVIEETTNVKDTKRIVRGYADGHVALEPKPAH